MKAEELIEEIELDYLEYVSSDIKERKKLLPITDPDKIKNLIWNLLTSSKWRNRMSYNTYKEIIDIWIKRTT